MNGLAEWTPTRVAPQGAVLSPLLSNVYLDPLDHQLADLGLQMVRYADDFVILCRTAQEAQRALELLRTWVAENGLALHPTKTRVVDVRSESFEFLGYYFRGSEHGARDKSVQRFKESVRKKTPRKSGNSLKCTITDLNRVLRGWFAYFQHSRRSLFDRLDQFIRQRLRAILKKRRRRPGIAKGADFQRWPNDYFAKHGLFSLAAAHARARQSSRR